MSVIHIRDQCVGSKQDP